MNSACDYICFICLSYVRLSCVYDYCSVYSCVKYFTPGSINSLFSNFVREIWRGMFGGVRDYLEEMLGGFYKKPRGKLKDNYTRKKAGK